MLFFNPSATVPPAAVNPRHQNVKLLAKSLHREVSDFLEHAVEVQGEFRQRPRLPIFFVKTFNILKAEAADSGLQDAFLDFIPIGIQMPLLTEFGPSEDYPKTLKNGQLEEKPRPLAEEIHQFYTDVVEYVRNTLICTGNVPVLPHAYYVTLEGFQRKVFGSSTSSKDSGASESGIDKENTQLVFRIPGNMQAYLTGIVGNAIGEDYVAECTKRHYETFGPIEK